MRWPWSRRAPETRASYTDSLTSLLVREAAGSTAPTGQAHSTSVAEGCIGMYARAGALAEQSPDVAALDPATLASIFRSLIVGGESVHLIRVSDAGLLLLPVGDRDVYGDSPDPDSWTYRVTLDGPSGSVSIRDVPAAAVLHVRYSYDPSRPWVGVSPLLRAGLGADLVSALSQRLKEEASAASAVIVPMPENPDDDDDGDGRPDPTASLAADIKAAKGGVLFSETLMGGDRSAAPQQDWGAKRIGSMIPEVNVKLLDMAGLQLAGALGVPASLVDPDADGTAQREGWRRFAHGSVVAVARLVEAEVRKKLDVAGWSLDFGGLYASDLIGRAGAFQRLVAGGMSAQEAAALSGLLGSDE